MASLMIQGCGSDVGKSVLVAGLCRLFANRGVSVRPIKPQNMSNNAAVTADGGEIGRAQALQAMACRVPPTVDMNPVLLKPQSDVGAQVIVRGKRVGNQQASTYQGNKGALLDVVLDSFHRLQSECDLVLVEGAGSPAEINLRANDIANMGFARAANVPVALVGDIDRGHVIAALVGAHSVLDAADRAMIAGFIINKFRGDPALFTDGRAEIVRRTGWRDYGMVSWLPAARRLPAEDAVVLQAEAQVGRKSMKVASLLLPHIANFDDFDPLQADPNVAFMYVTPGMAVPGDVDLLIIPGTKTTLGDLAFLRQQGWDVDIAAHVRRGGRVLGICGGMQMLGMRIADPGGIEGAPAEADGLGYLDLETLLTEDKVLRPVTGHLTDGGGHFQGYEMHVGRTTGPALGRPFATLDEGRTDGAVSGNGRIAGTYVHGLLQSGAARAAILGVGARARDHQFVVDALLDEIAAALEQALDVPALATLAGLKLP